MHRDIAMPVWEGEGAGEGGEGTKGSGLMREVGNLDRVQCADELPKCECDDSNYTPK